MHTVHPQAEHYTRCIRIITFATLIFLSSAATLCYLIKVWWVIKLPVLPQRPSPHQDRLEPPETAASHRCAQCSHQTVCQFQLDHHVQRKHRNVYTAELFHAGIDPEEYSCTRCDFKSNYKLCRYEHCNDHGTVASDNTKTDHFFKNRSCTYCNYKGHSSLSLCKHLHSCGAATARETPPADCTSISEMEFQIVRLLPENLNDSTISSRYQKVASEEKVRYDCNECSYSTTRKRNLRAHVPTHGTALMYNCDQCSYRGKQSRNLRIHMWTHLTVPALKWINCDKCSYRTTNNGSAHRHKLTHASDDEIKWFYCAKCPYRGKVKSNLKAHVLLRHARPEDVDWFGCAQCSYRTKLKWDLKTHMLSHVAPDEIEWFRCEHCPYRAKRRHTLNKHVLVHVAPEQIRWFSCDKCSYSSKRKGGLQRHVVYMHAADDEVDWFECDKCSYRSRSKWNLASHVRSHATGDEIRWFGCDECSYRVRQKRNLKKHMLKAHVASTADEIG